MNHQNRCDAGEDLARRLGEVVEKFERWDRLQMLGRATDEWSDFRQEFNQLTALVNEVDEEMEDMV